ncbi:MAG: SLBB domain-containing protein [Bythopirellula sp.]|nr:SLBB domain-containing protein [Bythopirellula sp.]
MLLVSGLTGCQTANFLAGNLPQQYLAARVPGDISNRLTQLVGISSDNNTINPGDKLAVLVSTGRESEDSDPLELKVKENGTVEIPLVGTVHVAGQDVLAAAQSIGMASVDRGIYRQPHVTVDISAKATNSVTVMGAVEKPGVHEIPRNSSDLLHALAVAGGLTAEAGTRVEIIRNDPPSGKTRFANVNQEQPASQTAQSLGDSDPVELAAYSQLTSPPVASTGALNFPPASDMGQSYVVDLAAIQRLPASDQAYRLKDRDVVMVVPAQKRIIHVAGLVKNPGKYELPITENIHLLDAIALAGGYSSLVADKVLIIRRVPGQEQPITIQASLRRAKRNGHENLLVAPGDSISLEQTPTTIVVDTFARIIHFSVGVTGASTIF